MSVFNVIEIAKDSASFMTVCNVTEMAKDSARIVVILSERLVPAHEMSSAPLITQQQRCSGGV